MTTSSPSWWEGTTPAGFTVLAAKTLKQPIPVDDVSDREFQIVVERRQVLATLIGMRQAKANHGLRHAIVLSAN